MHQVFLNSQFRVLIKFDSSNVF